MFDKYRVNSNESLSEIARKFDTTVSYLEDLNNLYLGDHLRAGMDIIVPKNNKKYFDSYTISKGDTLYAIGRKYNINPTLLAAINGLNMDDYIYPNQVILVPISNFSYYITKDGDTVETVREMFNTNREKLLKENETIYLLPGQIMVSSSKNK